MKKLIITLALAAATAFTTVAQIRISLAETYGIKPDRKENISPKVAKALNDIKKRYPQTPVCITFAPGRYNFHPKGSTVREYYISNHDQDNPKNVGIAIENWDNVTVEASGAEFVFHGRMLPIAIVGSANCTLSGFSIDFEKPHITQVEILANGDSGMEFRVSPQSDVCIDHNGALTAKGEGWSVSPRSGIAFDPATHHLVFRTSDLYCPVDSIVPVAEHVGTFRAPKWHDPRLTPGTIVALRGWGRPTPGIFLSENRATTIKDVKVHYAEGMSLLAQVCDSITLDGFNVCLRGDSDPRYFTTQADATHFSGCKGLITSINGLYEGMMDDAINVHGTYLKVTKRNDNHTLTAQYMHSQSYGFKWGEAGDTVQFISARTMETIPGSYTIESISEINPKELTIRLAEPLNDEIDATTEIGIENLTWTPEVYFADNVIRNNRARGSLFSTPRHTLVERNTFDHTSGTAILLCGDCMGWYETGACRDITIRNNRFINALTNIFQFTEAIISIYPEIHDLQGQQKYFHSDITIENNEFETFDAPLLYAKSTDGLTFRNNKVTLNHDFPQFHPNRWNFKFQHCKNITISDNDMPQTPSINFE